MALLFFKRLTSLNVLANLPEFVRHSLANEVFAFYDICQRHLVEKPRGHRQEGRNLRRYRKRLVLRLFQHLSYALTPGDYLPCVVVQARPEAGEGFLLFKLGI